MSYNWDIWYNKTIGKICYKNQMDEAINDIKDLGETYLDVGCGKGRLLQVLVNLGKVVDGLDINYNNFDLLKDQWPEKQYDVCFANLVLLHFNENEALYVIKHMTGKYVYFFDEFRPEWGFVEQSGKWNHDFKPYMTGYEEIFRKESAYNKIWWRFLYRKIDNEN